MSIILWSWNSADTMVHLFCKMTHRTFEPFNPFQRKCSCGTLYLCGPAKLNMNYHTDPSYNTDSEVLLDSEG